MNEFLIKLLPCARQAEFFVLNLRLLSQIDIVIHKFIWLSQYKILRSKLRSIFLHNVLHPKSALITY